MTSEPNATKHENALARANRLRRSGRSEEALTDLRNALQRREVPAESMQQAGRWVLRELATGGVHSPLRVLMLGQCTTSWLAPTLAAVAWRDGIPCIVREGGYDSVAQDVAELPRIADTDVTILVLLPWHHRLYAARERSPETRVDDELQFWREVWGRAAAARVSRIIQVGYDWVSPGPAGHHLSSKPGGEIDIVSRVNVALRDALPAGAYYLPLDQVSGTMGRKSFYDSRRYIWTKQPFSERGTVALAEHLSAALRAVTTGPRKVVVVDLDNTIWGGVVGEAGPEGIVVGATPEGEAFVAFQRHLKSLADRGVLLAVCSKNNLRDAREPFVTNPNMVLSLNDFAAFEATWDPKTDSLRRIAAKLNLGLDSFVFFDDNSAERELVRQSIPEVAVPEVPSDPAEYVRALESGLWFESVTLTAEDVQRSAQYAADSKRRESSEGARSIGDYLRSLDMFGEVRKISEADTARVVQLLAKTNQFNLTSRRHGTEQLTSILTRDGAFGLTLRMRDRFGDHGLVAVGICVPSGDDAEGQTALLIDTFLMSCRVIARTAEHFLLREILVEARQRGYASVIGEFLPTPKNELVSGFYESVGFVRLPDHAGAPSRYRYVRATTNEELPMSFVQKTEPAP